MEKRKIGFSSRAQRILLYQNLQRMKQIFYIFVIVVFITSCVKNVQQNDESINQKMIPDTADYNETEKSIVMDSQHDVENTIPDFIPDSRTEDRYTPLKFVEFATTQNGYTFIKLSYTLQNNEVFVLVDYTEWNNYCVILWDEYANGFDYSTKPGVYLFTKNTNELRYITSLGVSEHMHHAWTVFTEDFEYLIQDSGAASIPRGIKVWRLKDQKLVFSGMYYHRKIDKHTIEVAYYCKDTLLGTDYTDKEILLYGKTYMEQNSIPQELEEKVKDTTLGIDFIVNCSIDLDTGERKILGGEYILAD